MVFDIGILVYYGVHMDVHTCILVRMFGLNVGVNSEEQTDK